MNDWTLGAVHQRGMKLEASCKKESCGHFYTFDLERLIEAVGSEYPISDIPPMTCEHCGGPLKIELAMGHREAGD
ncbi:MAG: hypothetical protein ACREDN_09430 [Aestuariivirga sp.]